MLELIANVRGGEAPAEDVHNWNASFVNIRIVWNTSSGRIERWKVHFPTCKFALHAIEIASLGELKLASFNCSTISFDDLGVVTMSAGFLNGSLKEIVDQGLIHWLTGDEEATNLARFGDSRRPILGELGGERGSVRLLHGAGSVFDLQRVGQSFGGRPTIGVTFHGLALKGSRHASRRCDREGTKRLIVVVSFIAIWKTAMGGIHGDD